MKLKRQYQREKWTFILDRVSSMFHNLQETFETFFIKCHEFITRNNVYFSLQENFFC